MYVFLLKNYLASLDLLLELQKWNSRKRATLIFKLKQWKKINRKVHNLIIVAFVGLDTNIRQIIIKFYYTV